MHRIQRFPLIKWSGSRRSYHFKQSLFGFSAKSPAEKQNLIEIEKSVEKVEDVSELYQKYGFRAANLDPLGLWDNSENKKLLRDLSQNLSSQDVTHGEFIGKTNEFIDYLEKTYCSSLAIEFKHLNSLTEQKWLAEEFERLKRKELEAEEKKDVADKLLKALAYEKFLETKIPTLKRYSGEGAEAGVAFHAKLLQDGPKHNLKEFIWGGAHRGRFALHTILFGLEPDVVLRKIRGMPEFPDDVDGSGDVLSHLNCHYDVKTPDGTIHVSTVPNPSHLEVAGPVAVGKSRGRSLAMHTGDYGEGVVGDEVLCVHYHGDGAFTGQGIVWETLSMAQVPHYRIGGSIHVVANNQLAFTAEKDIGRSSLHCTDYAKALDCPVIHINASSPEDAVRAAELALNYRQKFRKDIFVNLHCFRRHGHNEIDNPRFTNPRLYAKVDATEDIPDVYTRSLVDQGVVEEGFGEKIKEEYQNWLNESLARVDGGKTEPKADHLKGYWSGYQQAPKAVTVYPTGLDTDLLRYIGKKSVTIPDEFNVHPHILKTHVNARIQRLEKGENIDWATAEAFAFGSLLLQGFDVRISGQDVGRATFSHRHGVLVDQKSDEVYVPLNNISPDQKHFYEAANSPLSEEAVLAFEYGFSIDNSKRLVIWEAQFGDFYNTAQVQIDTLIASGESKWLRQSGLVMMLPHGLDGAGPDHSSAHMERFLQLTDSREDQKPADGDNVNMHVVNPTTSAQYFHLLRRQCLTPFRKPLIIISPKVLLRHPQAASPLSEFGEGTHFHPVLDDVASKPDKVKKVVFVSGKHAVLLMAERSKRNLEDTAIVRLERLCPFPVGEIRETLQNYKSATKFVWSQEEPRNAGAWAFVNPRFQNGLGIELKYAGRPEIAWMATSIGQHHQKEAEKVLTDTFQI
ncbi:unnamed protein product [Bursaphelenchus okinawaensis]|uniref:Transketolase-like pyrimidine-binding domain-containing protein n=1 Tax=Bursaphelenchus okinawaensis TaxID=465554 RepID=A0A811L6S8_9BILA|nr:unnamed protein product [Bursaphelenchus okinawaensis]CAG9119155.1 unnamed protein product [Bursaphelenchus okinawaensis]